MDDDGSLRERERRAIAVRETRAADAGAVGPVAFPTVVPLPVPGDWPA
jgi:hypothetical protein